MACHNEGRGLGVWISAEQAGLEYEAEAVTYGGQGQIMTYGSGATFIGCKVCGGDEWELVDHENVPYGFRDLRAFYGNALSLAECDDLDTLDIFAAWYNAGSYITSLAELVAEHEDRYRGEWSTMREYAEDYAEQTGLLAGLPGHLERYFDFDVLAHDLEMDHYFQDGRVWFAS